VEKAKIVNIARVLKISMRKIYNMEAHSLYIKIVRPP